MSPPAPAKRPMPALDYSAVLEELAKQRTSTTETLLTILKQQDDRLAEERQEFKQIMKELKTSQDANTLALHDLKNTLENKERDCREHDKAITALQKEVIGDGSPESCAVKSRTANLERRLTEHEKRTQEKQAELERIFADYRSWHNDESLKVRGEIHNSIAALDKKVGNTRATAYKWKDYVLYTIIVLLGSLCLWFVKLHADALVKPAPIPSAHP